MNRQVEIFPSIEELNKFAAEKFVEIANEAIEKRGRFTVALAGGSTPKALYKLLARDKFKDKIDWSRVFFFFGDERSVLPGDPESNFGMAKETLFDPLQTAEENIFRWRTELENAEKIAEGYAETLREMFKAENRPSAHADGTDIVPPSAQVNKTKLISPSAQAGENDKFPRFDLILLGMGADGHTASLFPFTEALHETEKPAVANRVEKLRTTRLTLTFPVINNARNVIFLVAGDEKAETLQTVLERDFEPDQFPAQNVRPEHGELYWLLDENVAKLLKNDRN
jgi:6-phosphogluconolactonase